MNVKTTINTKSLLPKEEMLEVKPILNPKDDAIFPRFDRLEPSDVGDCTTKVISAWYFDSVTFDINKANTQKINTVINISFFLLNISDLY